MAMATKINHQVVCTPSMLTVTTSDGKLLYKSARFDSIESFLASDATLASGRVDVFMAETEKLDEATLGAIKSKSFKAAVSESFVLEVLNSGEGPTIMTEFINMHN